MTDTPKDRISNPTKLRSGVKILDIDHYAPFLLNAVSNAWQRKTSAMYRKEFDLGIVEWRVIAMLNIEPEITAHRICEVIRLDKAAVSRSLKLLNQRGLVGFEALTSDPRKRRWWLTESGRAIHAEIMEIALRSEGEMLAGVPPEDLEVFLAVIRRMLTNIDP
ncbi:MarR family winged helix-turn-helix transcriptional regulator [Antarctobacter sp.]|uniref:MarR family winged helix-turn-helix transcriptional regulator n=1 Tax=Antarctobacter sp. TaxID=1872577 RepID=UPI003A922532